MRIVLIDDEGIVYDVADDVEAMDFNNPFARSEIMNGLDLAMSNAKARKENVEQQESAKRLHPACPVQCGAEAS